MSPDPFDSLRDQNPAPEDRLPDAPMSMAERIISSSPRHADGRSWPGWSIAAVAAVAVLVVGGVWMLWLGTGRDPIAASSTTSSTAGTGTTAAAGTSTTAATAAEQIRALLDARRDIEAEMAALGPVIEELSAELDGATGDAGAALEARLAEATDRFAELQSQLSRLDADLEALGVQTTTGPATTTTVAAGPAEGSGVVYLLVDDHSGSGDPTLMPVDRPFSLLSGPVDDPVMTTLDLLLDGPTPGESEGVPAISSAVPYGVTLLGVTVSDGVATLDLSAEFVSGGGSLSMQARLAQVVYTATRFPEVDAVRFAVDGEPTTVFGGEGVILDDPADRSGFDDLLPAIMIESPAHWGRGENPLRVTGTANVFEATVSVALTDAEGLILWEGFTTATCGNGCHGDWEVAIPYQVDEPQLGAVIAWEISARDGSQINVREHPVWLVPSDAPTPADVWTVTERWEQFDTDLSEVLVAWPQVGGPEPASRLQAAVDRLVAGARATFTDMEANSAAPEGDRRNYFSLGFEVLWQSEDYLVLEFVEYYEIADSAHGFNDRYAVNFDLTTGDQIDVADLFTAEGLISFSSLVSERVRDELGTEIACCEGDPAARTAVIPGGLVVVLDMIDGLPPAMGYLDLVFTWGEVDDLLDPGGPAERIKETLPSCSARGLVGPVPQQGLPPAVAAARDTIYNTASNCNWNILGELAGEDLTYSFGLSGDPIGYWLREEAKGRQPLRYLAELLDRPHEVIQDGGLRYYVWPSAHAYAWADVPDADREALRPLYDDEDFAGFATVGGYAGYRIGISDTGEWMFFVAGD